MERLAAVLLLAAVAGAASAQGPVAPALGPAPRPVAAAAVPIPDTADPVHDYDVTFANLDERMTVPVQVSGVGPSYPFIIDTGAQRSVISRQLARRLGLSSGPRVRLIATTGASHVDTVIVPSLRVGDAAAAGFGGERIEAPALEGAHLGAPGMLGIDTLQGRALAIDFDRQTMTVSPARDRRVRRGAAPGEIVIQARSLFGQLVVTNATVGGRRVRVVLDTGTAVSLGNMALLKLVARRGRQKPAVLTSVTGGTLIADYAILGEMKLGAATITTLPVAFADAAPFRAFGIEDKPALLLGMDALKLFRRVDIDFANRELRLVMPRGATLAS